MNYKKTRSFPTLLLILCVFLLGACAGVQEQAGETPTASPEPGTPTPPAEQAQFWSAWAGSPHAQTYDLEKGPNTYCARCHAPANWDYQAKIDPPPNCVSCKFPNEPQVRIAVSNPLVPEKDWKHIGCEVCHQMENGAVLPSAAWLDNATGYHESITQPVELCEKCHTNTGMIQHGIDLGEQAHTELSCTNCHDPHSTIASCVNSGCHADVLAARLRPSQQHANLSENAQCQVCHTQGMLMHSMETQREGSTDCLGCHLDLLNVPPEGTAPQRHSKSHAVLDCVTCHDASGLAVGPANGSATWTTFRTVQTPAGATTSAYASHNLTRQVNCQRCHFEGNEWGLPEIDHSAN